MPSKMSSVPRPLNERITGHIITSPVIFLNPCHAPHTNDNSELDITYNIFGEVVRGMDVVDKIVDAIRDDNDNPLTPVTMTVKE